MACACRISEAIKHLEQHQYGDFVLNTLWHTYDVRRIDASVT